MGLLKAMISLAVNLCLKNYIVLYFCGGSGIGMNFFRFLNTGPDVMLNLTDHVEASRSCWSILIMLVLTDHAGAY